MVSAHQKGFVHVVLLLAVVVIVLAVLVYIGVIKAPSLPFLSKSPKVEVETKYSNPFKKETQYVNPFETYKNPFVVSR